MVLNGFLEDFLQRACAAWRIEDSAFGYRQDAILADAVVEILGNVGGEWSGGLMAVQPGGDAQAQVVILRITLANAKCCIEPSFILVGRCSSHDVDGVHKFQFVPSSHPCSQMCCFHRSRSPSADHQEAFLCKQLAQADDLLVLRVSTQYAVTSHDAYDRPLVELSQKLVETVADGVVVESSSQGFLDVVSVFTHGEVMFVDESVVAGLVAFRVAQYVSFVQFVRRVEMVPVAECLAHVGKEEAIARLSLESLRQGAADEDAVAIGVAHGHFRLGCEVDTLESAAAYLLHALPENLCQLPVILDLIIVLSHTDVHLWCTKIIILIQ